MEKPDVNALAQKMIAAVKVHVAAAVAAFVTRDELDARLKAIPAGPRGEKGDAGERGADADPQLIREAVDAALPALAERVVEDRIEDVKQYALMGLKGDPGKQGERGERGPAADLEPLRAQMIEEVARRVDAVADEITVPKDGKDGRDGADGKEGAPGRDAAELDILPSIDEAKSYRRGTWASHNGGLIRAARQTDPVKDGALLEAGWVVMVEGLACPPVFTQGDDPREITCAAMLTSGVKATTTFRMPAMVYQEVWREGEYEHGDVVTYAGSAWHCQEKTTDQPGNSAAWKLMVKKGAPGKDGVVDAPAVTPVVRTK